MKNRQHVFMSVLVNLAAVAVIIPVLLLGTWCFANRFPWPELFPSELSLRGVNRLLSGNSDTWQTLLFGIGLSLLIAVLATVIATMTARAIIMYSFRGKRLVKGLILLPLAVPATVFGMGGHTLFLRLGIGNTVFAVVIGHLIYCLPFAVRIMSDVTTATSLHYEEQASSLGARPFLAFWYGSVPILAPGIVSALSVSFLMSFTQYFLTLILGGGKVNTFAVHAFPLLTGSDRTISSVYSILYIVTTLTIFVIFRRLAARLAKRAGAQLMT